DEGEDKDQDLELHRRVVGVVGVEGGGQPHPEGGGGKGLGVPLAVEPRLGKLRPRCGIRQFAVKPFGPTSREVGRYAPMKLGSGQAEVMPTRVSMPSGANRRVWLPPNERSKANGTVRSLPAPSPGSGAWMPASRNAPGPRPGRKSLVPLPQRT